MYLEISKKQLNPLLKNVVGVVEQRTTIPVMANVMVTVNGNTLTLIGSDSEIEIACSLEFDAGVLNKDNEGATTIPARKFSDICKSLPEKSDIQINVEENQALLKSGRSRFKLQTLPAEDFPNTPALDNPVEIQLEQHRLKYLIEKTLFSVANNDVRYYLNGLLFEVNEEILYLVGTDGHRLAIANCEIQSKLEARFILPKKAAIELSKLLQDDHSQVRFSSDEHHVRFTLNDNLILTSKLIDGEFPDWKVIIPKHEKSISIETVILKQALSRASILSNEKYKGVRLGFSENQLAISAKNAQAEEAEETLELHYHYDTLEIGVNGVYLMDVLNAIDAQNISLHFSDENESILITEEGNEDCQFIVMPMKL